MKMCGVETVTTTELTDAIVRTKVAQYFARNDERLMCAASLVLAEVKL